MVQIGHGHEKVQLILDEPPESLYNKWANERIEFYKRVEPNAPVRDAVPELTVQAKYRLRLRKQVSEVIWNVILSNPEKRGLEAIQQLGLQHEQRKITFVPASKA